MDKERRGVYKVIIRRCINSFRSICHGQRLCTRKFPWVSYKVVGRLFHVSVDERPANVPRFYSSRFIYSRSVRLNLNQHAVGVNRKYDAKKKKKIKLAN